ncbi:MAG: GntR family transcriptional regulator [Moraxellaceae bacterium]|nr:GntR family transcriptional regulator [Moraxellaceae bacterium]
MPDTHKPAARAGAANTVKKPSRATATDAAPVMAADRVYQAIYTAVLDHRLTPGSRLREEELAQAFGVSRTLVRQALHRLSQDGVILLRPNRGAEVPVPTRRDGEHVFDARRVVECEVARRLAGKLAASDMDTLRQIVDAEAKALQSQNKQDAIRLSGEFHLALARMCGNPIFVRLLEELLPSTSLLMALYKAPGEPMCVAHGHHQLLDILEHGAGTGAATEMRRHLNEIERSLSQPAEKKSIALEELFRDARVE